jgi:hypothetical protein
MTDRSADGGCSPGQQEQPDRGQGGAAPPHLSSHNEDQQVPSQREVQQDPHQLQPSQGELRHRLDEARGVPTGAATPDQRHPSNTSTHPSDLLDAAPVPSQTFHPTSSSTDPPPTTTSSSTGPTPTTGAITAASSIGRHTPAARLIDRDHSEPSSVPSSGVATPTPDHKEHHRHHLKLRPLIHAVMAFEKSRKFSTGTSVHRKRQMSTLVEKEGHFGPTLTVRCSPRLTPITSWLFARLELRNRKKR